MIPVPDLPVPTQVLPHFPADRRHRDRLLARFSTVSLVIVVLAIGSFALWSAWYTRESSVRAIASSRLSNAFAAAAAAVSAQESLERKYRLEPGRAVRQRVDNESGRMFTALDMIDRDGEPRDRDISRQVRESYVPYRQALQRLFAAVDRQDAAEVLRIDGEEVDPRFDVMDGLVRQATIAHDTAQVAALADLQAREHLGARATPVAMFAALLLALIFSGVLRRTSAQLDAERVKAVHDAMHDALTGLPNRTLMADRFEQALRAGRRDSTSTGLLLIDLDRFKEVNDTLGHHVGDQLLAQVGPRLGSALRGVDTVARLGGDEFAVLLPNVNGIDGALEVARRVRDAIVQSFRVEDVELDIDASIGVVVSGVHGRDASSLLQHADVAMYVAKQERRGVVVYDPVNDGHSPERLSLLGQLRRGIERGELLLHYQPKIDLRTRKLTGVEALVRWQHPDRGLVQPDDFIPLAEHTGLIGPLTMQVLKLALAQAKAWADAGCRIPVAVNLSARNLHDEDFGNKVSTLLREHGVPAELLEVELTESAVMLEPERAGRILNHLHTLGVRIAIDDFGAGYTSLAQLKHLPISELKIDKSFIQTMHTNADNALIVRSMIDLGHSLRMAVVAEGIETAFAASTLRDYRCDVGQGYHLCRPVDALALMDWHEERGPFASSEHLPVDGVARIDTSETMLPER